MPAIASGRWQRLQEVLSRSYVGVELVEFSDHLRTIQKETPTHEETPEEPADLMGAVAPFVDMTGGLARRCGMYDRRTCLSVMAAWTAGQAAGHRARQGSWRDPVCLGRMV